MSPSPAGFAFLLYVCAVTGQQYPGIRLSGNRNDPSIAIDTIVGGDYPAGSFSIGYGQNNPNGDGGHGADYGGNGYVIPSQRPPQRPPQRPSQPGYEGGFVNGENDIGGYGGQNSYNNQQQPPANNHNHASNIPVRNSASRNGFLAGIWRYIASWF